MAFPSVRSSNSGQATSDGTNDRFRLTLPATIGAGDLVFWALGSDGDDSYIDSGASPKAWVDLDSDATYDSGEAREDYTDYQVTGTAATLNYGAFLATGDEDGKYLYVEVVDGSEPAWYIVYSIQGHGLTSLTGFSAYRAEASGTDRYPNPPALDPGDAADYLWITVEANDHTDTLTFYPNDFTDNQLDARGTASGDAGIAAATRNYNTGSSYDPYQWTIYATEEWACITVAIPPAGPQTVTLGLLSAATLYAPEIRPEQPVTLPLLAAATLYAPTSILSEQNLVLPIIPAGSFSGEVGIQAVTYGDQYATLPLISAATLYAPTAAYGKQYATLPLVSAATLWAPDVELTVTLPVLSAATLYAPQVQPSITLPLLSAPTLWVPDICNTLTLPLLGGTVLYAPDVEPTVTLPLLNPAALFEPTLTRGGAETTVARLTIEAAATPDTGDCLMYLRARNTDNAGTLHADLYEGATLRHSWEFEVTDTFTTYEHDFTAEAASISNWATLELRVKGVGEGQWQISGFWMVLPETTGAQAVTLPLLSALTAYAPTVGLTSIIPLLAPASLFEVTVTYGDQYLTLGLLDTPALFEPTLTHGTQYLTLTLLEPASLYAPQLNLEGIVPLLAPTTLWAPMLCQVVSPDVIWALTMFPPQVAYNQQVTLDDLLVAATLWAPNLEHTVTLPLLAPAALYGPMLQQQQNITLTLLAPVSLLDLLVAPEQAITLPLLQALTILAPIVWYGRERLTWTVYLQGAVDGIAYVSRSTNPAAYAEPAVGEEVQVEVSRAAAVFVEQARTVTVER